MANNLDSNTTRKVARIFLKKFEASRVLTKTVDTQLLSGQFDPASGDNVDFKRPHQYRAEETTDGDISGTGANDIISGKATGTVQNFLTVPLSFTSREEALELDQLEEIIAPAADELVTRLETNLGDFMIKNSGLSWGTVGTAVDDWKSVVQANSLMQSVGVPQDSERFYIMNPFTSANLAAAQTGLTSADQLVRTAWEDAQIATPFAGLRSMSSNALTTYTAGATTDRAGTLNATPDGTYVTHKDTMIQALQLTGLSASITDAVRVGDVLEFTQADRTRMNVMTRRQIFDDTGAAIKWRCTVVTGGDTNVSGEVTVTVAAAAINETDGQYNNIFSALTSGDTFNILGTEDVVYQPNLFYHKQAFGLGTVSLPKLFATDTIATTADGMSIRVTKYSDGDKNTQKIRFDLLPAFATFNPQFAGTGWKV